MNNIFAETLLLKFSQEIETEYRGEHYRVRDNGAVCRQSRTDQRKRPLDDVWTFGRADPSTGYMHHGCEVVHRIVATAFHGAQPSKEHIVDHIDTNRRNNRLENLRWITRLDNVLLNPITLRRIIIAYGSLETFFENPRGLAEGKSIKAFEWMRTVSKEEAQESRKKLLGWAQSGQLPKGGLLGEWVYARQLIKPVVQAVLDIQSLKPNAIQRNWKTPTDFVWCPDETLSLSEYAARLEPGTVFARNAFGESIVVAAEKRDEFMSVVCRLTDNPIKGWALCKVTIENGKFVHEAVRTYFSLEGALKGHNSPADAPFEDSIDDYS